MNQRDQKKAQFTETSRQSKTPLWAGLALAAVVAVAISIYFAMPGDSAGLVTARNGTVSIPLADVDDGQAHFYRFAAAGQTVSFFLLKSGDGAIRAALDACDVCYKSLKGYRQEGDFMVCNNCNQQFASDMINVVKGGCNPAPLTRNIVDGQVVLHERELLDGRRYFPNRG